MDKQRKELFDEGNSSSPNHAPLPLTPGFEVTGIIEEVGADVSTLSKGTCDTTHVNEGYAEYTQAASAHKAISEHKTRSKVLLTV